MANNPPYNLSDPTGSDSLDSPSHADMHTEVNRAIDDFSTDPALNPPDNTLQFYRADGTWGTPPTGGGGSGGTAARIAYVVAANDSPQFVKDDADYVCTGSADQVQINNAITDAHNDGGGQVLLGPGTFQLNNSVLPKGHVALVGAGSGATRLRMTVAGSLTSTPGGAEMDQYCDGIIHLDSNSSADCGMIFRDFYIDGNSQPNWTGMFLYRGGNNSDLDYIGPDNINRIENIAISHCGRDSLSGSTKDYGMGIFFPGYEKIRTASTNDFGQGTTVNNVRIFHTAWHGFMVNTPDLLVQTVDVGSFNRASNMVGYGFYNYGGNNHYHMCKAWYGKKGGVADVDSGSGWFCRSTRSLITACEGQDNAGHGFLLSDYSRGTFTGLLAHNNNATHSDGAASGSDNIRVEGGAHIYMTYYGVNETISGVIGTAAYGLNLTGYVRDSKFEGVTKGNVTSGVNYGSNDRLSINDNGVQIVGGWL